MANESAKVFNVPTYVHERLLSLLSQANYRPDEYRMDLQLYFAARAVTWAHMAAAEIEGNVVSAPSVEYHCYAGISAIYTAIDALAHWLYRRLGGLGGFPDRKVGLGQKEFRKAVRTARPDLIPTVERLVTLMKSVEQRRNDAQHRATIELVNGKEFWQLYDVTEEQSDAWVAFMEGRWYFDPGDRAELKTAKGRADCDVAQQLNGWAAATERAIRLLADAFPVPTISKLPRISGRTSNE
jgi:hypothetical protein